MHEDETLRHLIAKALYEEDGWPDRDWHEVHDDKRVGWLDDADRALKVIAEWLRAGRPLDAETLSLPPPPREAPHE